MTSTNARLGYVYYPDDRHYTKNDLKVWLPVLEDLGARWLILKGSTKRAVPEAFIAELKEASIEPVIHIPCKVSRVESTEMNTLFESYNRWGVRHVVVFDRPNMRRNWEQPDWGKPGLVERFMDYCLPILEAQKSSGLKPALPPLEPGGDYWDLAFLGDALKSLIRRGKQDLLQDITIAIYAWVNGQPLDWGAGGSSNWPEAQPYHTPEGCQNQIGFRIFDWYAEIGASVVGSVNPMLVIGGGELPSKQHATTGPDRHVEQNLAIARALSNGAVPVAVQNFAFHLLTSSPESPEHDSAWYPAPDQPRPVVAAFQRFVKSGVKQTVESNSKQFSHYVLLPSPTVRDVDQYWTAIWPFIHTNKPVIGFSKEEAMLARRVTLVGDESIIPEKIEVELRSNGCRVERFSGIAVGNAIAPSDPIETISCSSQ